MDAVRNQFIEAVVKETNKKVSSAITPTLIERICNEAHNRMSFNYDELEYTVNDLEFEAGLLSLIKFSDGYEFRLMHQIRRVHYDFGDT